MRRWLAWALVTAVVAGGAAACSKERPKPFQLKGQVHSNGPGLAVALYQTVGVRMVPGNHIQWANNGAVFNTIAEEMSKVTWPTRKETSSSTIVVVVTSIVAAVMLFLFDSVWAAVTDLVYKV